MSIYRHQLWTDVAAVDEHLTVFLKLDEALESLLGDFGLSSHQPYKISTGGGAVDRPSRAQISAAIDTLGGSLHSLAARYNDTDGSRTVGLHTQPFPAHPVERIAVSLDVHGDDEHETAGRFDTLKNRMDAEIRRQFPPSSATPHEAAQLVATVSSPAPVSPASAKGFKRRVSGFLRHPTGAQIVGALVVAGVLALIGVLSNVLGG